MDLLAAQRRNGQHWNVAKIGTFVCFIVAGGILIASLLLPYPQLGGSDNGLAATLSGPAH
jgi:hypothetical protein